MSKCLQQNNTQYYLHGTENEQQEQQKHTLTCNKSLVHHRRQIDMSLINNKREHKGQEKIALGDESTAKQLHSFETSKQRKMK